MMRRAGAVLVLVTAGCYQVSTIDEADAASDAGPAPDAVVTSCMRWGDTIGCDGLCDEPCPAPLRCNPGSDLCGVCDASECDLCRPRAGGGATSYCGSGRPCAITSDDETDPGLWRPGTCVDPEFCRFIQSGGPTAFELCRYSDGTLFVDGPPDDECAAGADPDSPFCGGRCGDTCLGRYAACVGVSEDRGFGVCTRNDFKCDVDELRRGVSVAFTECETGWDSVSDECACFVPSPAVRPEFEGLHGWMVSLESCLAYRDAYPDHVSCRLRGGNEAP